MLVGVCVRVDPHEERSFLLPISCAQQSTNYTCAHMRLRCTVVVLCRAKTGTYIARSLRDDHGTAGRQTKRAAGISAISAHLR